MRLTHRLKRIERAVAPTGGCRVCRGKGPMPRVLVWHEGAEPKPEHPACPGCGRRPAAVKLIILDRTADAA